MKKQLFISVLCAFSWGMLLSCSTDDKEMDNGEDGTEQRGLITESLVQEGKTWLMDYELVVSPEYGRPHATIEMTLKGDTIINGIHYMKLYKRECREGEEMPLEWTATQRYYGQDSGKVYMYDGYMDYTFPIVDFSLKVGDVFSYTYPDVEKSLDLKVTAVSDTILEKASEPIKRKCLYLECVNRSYDKHIWIDGIGSMQYGILGIYYSAAGSHKRLMKCSESDRILYQYE